MAVSRMHFLIVSLASRDFRQRDTLASKREVGTAANGETKIPQTNLTSLSLCECPRAVGGMGHRVKMEQKEAKRLMIVQSREETREKRSSNTQENIMRTSQFK